MKKLIFTFLILLSFSFVWAETEQDSVDKPSDIAPEMIEKLSSDQVLELMKEKEKLKRQHELDAQKAGMNFVNSAIPSDSVKAFGTFVFFSFLILLVIVPLYFSQRKAKLRFDLFTKFIDSNKEIPKELLPSEKRTHTDLHKSIILISVGAGVGLFMLIIDSEKNYWAIGLIPIIIGLGYFLSHKLDKKNETIVQ